MPTQSPRLHLLYRLLPVAILLTLLGGCVVAPVTETAEAGLSLVPTFTPTFMPEPASETVPTEPPATPTPMSTPTLIPTPTPVASLGTGIVNAGVLNVRSGPGTDHAVLGQIQQNFETVLLEVNAAGTWWRICCLADGITTGWVRSTYLDMEIASHVSLPASVLTATPVPQPTPTPALLVPSNPHDLWEITVAMALNNLPEQRYSHPPTNTSPLTGLPVASERLFQRALAVCIPSDVQAQPQSGLIQADIVYEYLVDGDQITRMTGIFYGEDAPIIGPIRSARLINFYLGYLYSAATMCSGASDQIRRLLREVAEFPFFDIDLDNPNGTLPYSFLIGSGLTRYHTHTLGLRRWLQDTLREQPMDLQGFLFGEPAAGGTPVSYLYIPYPIVSSAWVEFRYRPDSGQYLRFVGGKPHVDRNTSFQLAPQNVIVQYVPHTTTYLVEDALGSLSLDQNIFGSGRALVFRDGYMYEGTWSTDSLGQLPRFQMQDGQDIPLRPGRTWIAMVPEGYRVTVE